VRDTTLLFMQPCGEVAGLVSWNIAR
jgi:hypothetical protein